MRYWFLPEIEHLIKEAGFEILNHGEWMTSKRLDFDTWGVYSRENSMTKSCYSIYNKVRRQQRPYLTH
jgi:hypothetical protein